MILESFFRATFLLDPEGWNESMSAIAIFVRRDKPA